MAFSNISLYNSTNTTKPAGVGKIKTVNASGKYDLELADGRVIKDVGGFGNFQWVEGQSVTYNNKDGNYQILQIAPYSF